MNKEIKEQKSYKLCRESILKEVEPDPSLCKYGLHTVTSFSQHSVWKGGKKVTVRGRNLSKEIKVSISGDELC